MKITPEQIDAALMAISNKGGFEPGVSEQGEFTISIVEAINGSEQVPQLVDDFHRLSAKLGISDKKTLAMAFASGMICGLWISSHAPAKEPEHVSGTTPIK